MQYSNTFRSLREAASDAISGVVVEEVGVGIHVEYGSYMSNHSLVIGPAHFVTTANDDNRRELSWKAETPFGC